MAKKDYNPALRRSLLEIVENQVRDNSPPETRATLERLMSEGFSREHAVELIATVVTSEIFDVLKRRQVFQHDRFVARLQALPAPPDDEEE